jgi:uncharacterized protein (DUF433 family)
MTKPSSRQYVEHRDGAYRVAGTRVSLDSLVHLFLDGRSPESIAQSFPMLSLEQVYGAVAFYLAHRPEVEAHLERQRAASEEAREQAHAAHSPLVRRLRELHFEAGPQPEAGDVLGDDARGAPARPARRHRPHRP